MVDEKLVEQTSLSRSPIRHWRDYLEVTKPNVVLLLVFTAIVGMALASPGWDDLLRAGIASLGIGLASASAAAINHVIDRRADAQMTRTKSRPIPQGNLSPKDTLVFALTIGFISMLMLWFFVNPLTATLTFFSLIGYAVIYTSYLKRATPQNIVIGGAAGAMPPVLGWASITNQVTAEPLLLFLIVFIWTPPHFWALAIHREKDYAKVNIPMLPVTHGAAFTRIQILLYTILLIVVTVLPYLIHMSGLIYLIGAMLLNAGFLYHVIRLQNDTFTDEPMKTFVYSINYLMLLFAFLLVDHYWRF